MSIRKCSWSRLRLRGYPPEVLAAVFSNVEGKPSLPPAKKKKETNIGNKVTFVTSYHPHFVGNSLRTILEESFQNTDAMVFFCKTKQLF